MNKKQALKLMQITKNTYELIGEEFSDTRNKVWPEMEMLVKKYIKTGDKVLDVGCGNARLVNVLPEVDYLGIDGSKILITKALKHLSTKTLRDINFKVVDILSLDILEEKNFDIIFMFASFNHIPSRELRLKVLADIKKILKPGGLLIMTNWNLWQMGVKKNIWNYKLKTQNTVNSDPKEELTKEQGLGFRDVVTTWQSSDEKKSGELYYRAFTKRELNKLFKKVGFKIMENYYSTKGEKTRLWNGRNIVSVVKN